MSTPEQPGGPDPTPADPVLPAPGAPQQPSAAGAVPDDAQAAGSASGATAEHVVDAPALTVPPLSVPSGSGGEVPPAPDAAQRVPAADALVAAAPDEPGSTAAAVVDTTGGPATGPDEQTRQRARRNVPALVAAGLVIALLVGTVAFLGLRLRTEARTETAREQAVAASRDAARLLFSYDFNTLQDDFAKGLAVTTGSFREEYSRTTTDVVTQAATEYKVVVLADVVESAVVQASPDEVTAIVFLNQATTSTRVEGQQVDASRVRMTLVERDGRWLVSRVQAL